MKKMKQKKVLEQSLCGVLALLGFAACAETSVEYGTPTMDFWVRGKVISDDGKALKDIQVIVKNENAYYNDEEGELVRMNDTIYTDSGGDTKKLIFNDIDGEANGGTFKSDSVCMKDMESKQIKKGDGNWYLGTYVSKEDIKTDFKLLGIMNMKKKMTVHRLLSGALVLLGFASCSNEDENWEIRCEYGTPYSKFLVKGTVTSDKDEPLKNIQVIQFIQMKKENSRPKT